MGRRGLLVVAPHPDDEVLGAGGTISHFIHQHYSVTVCIVTRPYGPDWSKEYIRTEQKQIAEAHRILGVARTVQLGLPTVKLDLYPQKRLNELLSKLVEEVKPDIMLVPHVGDVNSDHRLVHAACLVACRPLKHKVRFLWAYETLSETEWGRPIDPTVYVCLDFRDYRAKIMALSAYKSELKKFPHPRSLNGVLVQAQKRGCEVNTNFAEAFQNVRTIVDGSALLGLEAVVEEGVKGK